MTQRVISPIIPILRLGNFLAQPPKYSILTLPTLVTHPQVVTLSFLNGTVEKGEERQENSQSLASRRKACE